MKFKRKKHKEYEGIQLTSTNYAEVKAFMNVKPDAPIEHYNNESDYLNKRNPVGLFVKTPQGMALAKEGDYILLDNGAFYSFGKAFFEGSFDKIPTIEK